MHKDQSCKKANKHELPQSLGKLLNSVGLTELDHTQAKATFGGSNIGSMKKKIRAEHNDCSRETFVFGLMFTSLAITLAYYNRVAIGNRFHATWNYLTNVSAHQHSAIPQQHAPQASIKILKKPVFITRRNASMSRDFGTIFKNIDDSYTQQKNPNVTKEPNQKKGTSVFSFLGLDLNQPNDKARKFLNNPSELPKFKGIKGAGTPDNPFVASDGTL